MQRMDFDTPERWTDRLRDPDPRQVRIGIAALLVIALLIFGLVKLLGDDDDGGGGGSNVGPAAVSESELATMAADIDHQVYWLGPVPGVDQYEFTSTEDGRVYVRYLKEGAEAGDPRPDFLSVGTYSVPTATDALRKAADAGGSKGGVQQEQGFLLLEGAGGKSAYVVFNDEPDLQIEIYDPQAGNSLEFAKSGALRPLN